jgi:hypothetical protein
MSKEEIHQAYEETVMSPTYSETRENIDAAPRYTDPDLIEAQQDLKKFSRAHRVTTFRATNLTCSSIQISIKASTGGPKGWPPEKGKPMRRSVWITNWRRIHLIPKSEPQSPLLMTPICLAYEYLLEPD